MVLRGVRNGKFTDTNKEKILKILLTYSYINTIMQILALKSTIVVDVLIISENMEQKCS